MLRRLFVAIEFPADIVAYLETIQHDLQKTHFFKGNFVQPNLLHLTISFIGEVEYKDIETIIKQLQSVKHPPVNASLGRLGVFPSYDFMNVIWIALKGQGIEELSSIVNDKLKSFSKEEQREFVSHSTLARIKSITSKEELHKYITHYVVQPHSFMIKDFVLKESVLTAHGPMHTTVERFSFVN